MRTPSRAILLTALASGCTFAQVVATGLDNPRGLAFDDGALYVVEAGHGGAGPCFINSTNTNVCYGPSGAVTRISGGTQTRVLTGLPSLAPATGIQATGPHDIAIQNKNVVYLTIGLGAPPARREQLGATGGLFGQLVQANLSSGQWHTETDISAHEAATNPDGGALDSNPYGILKSGLDYVVADAGANAVVAVHPNHKIDTLAVFPNLATTPPRQAVPTSVVIGPDNAYYVGLLTGGPFAVGVAEVRRFVPGQAPTSFVTGLTNVVDLAFRPQDERLYVVEIAAGAIPNFATGALLRIEANGTKTPVASNLFAPGGVAFGPDGAAYVSVNSILPGAGMVVRIPIP
jgi:hypothetical protein